MSGIPEWYLLSPSTQDFIPMKNLCCVEEELPCCQVTPIYLLLAPCKSEIKDCSVNMSESSQCALQEL